MAESLKRLNAAEAAVLFAGWEETLIWSALEGSMGCLWTLDGRAAVCEIGDFAFLAGEQHSLALLLQSWRSERAREGLILVPREPAAGRQIGQIFGSWAQPGERYAFCKDPACFDHEVLSAYAAAIPQGVELLPFDRSLCEEALRHDWSRSFCCEFEDVDDFLSRGIGVAALQNGELVGGASSYTRYNSGIEIQVETRADQQRRGIALCCCARLVLSCLERNLYPSWDAASEASAALARRLGYRPAYAYPVWTLETPSEKENAPCRGNPNV